MSQNNKYKGLAPGIYFGLPEEIYHKDMAISRSDLLNILDTPRTYWDRSWMNPDRKFKDPTKEMEYGREFHMLLFEPKRFEREYFIFPLEEGNDGRKICSYENHTQMVDSINVLRAGKDSSLYLRGGYPEVTIVFDWEGIRFRVRIDYFGIIISTDFKGARDLSEIVLKSEFRKYGYDIQMWLYKLARKRFKEQFKVGEAHIYGEPLPDKKWLAQFMAEETNEFMFIFQRKTAPYPFLPIWPDDTTEQDGADRGMEAIQIYARFLKEYGLSPWPVSEGKTTRFSMRFGFVRDN